MSKKNDDFFKIKRPWSEVKDELLGCYLKPYMSKILHTRHPIVYIDCFAGKGKFEDGKDGSPIIALKIIQDCLDKTSIININLSINFLDLNYADDLRENLKEYSRINIISGNYENEILKILKNKENWNVFMYIDPYGIKALNCTQFDGFAKSHFNSIELLINMNSFGFIREACHALGASFENNKLFDDLVEYNSTKYDKSDKSIRELNEIAGGSYWQKIIENYRLKKIDGYEAENMFAQEYCKRLSENYNYVLNMPLRIKKGQRPKYRMIHVTNHRDGCLLMVDNICNRWQALQSIQSEGQISLWEENYNNQIIDDNDIREKVLCFFSKYKQSISLHNGLAQFFIKYGAICSTKKVKEILKKYEKEKLVEIKRLPPLTQYGQATTFMSEHGRQKVLIRWIV